MRTSHWQVSTVSTQYSVNKVQHIFVKNAANEKNIVNYSEHLILCTVSTEHN